MQRGCAGGPQAMRMGSSNDLEMLGRKGKGGRKPSSAASQAQKKYMDRQKVAFSSQKQDISLSTHCIISCREDKSDLQMCSLRRVGPLLALLNSTTN